MKNFFSLILAGVLGSVATVGGVKYLEQRNSENTTQLVDQPVARQVSNQSYGPQVPFDFTEAADKSLDAVVHIKAAESREKAYARQQNNPWSMFYGFQGPTKGSGSGVILTTDGYIVTNNHVVDFADDLEVTLHDGRIFKATKIGTYPDADLAVIKIDADNVKPVAMGNSDNVKVGEWVLAVGNPFDLTSTVTAGIVSAKGRELGIIKGSRNGSAIEDFIQTDAAVNPGNSGGALVDVQGNLIGINTAIATPTGTFAGYSFAIPINLAKPIVDNIISNKGNYSKPSLGATVTNVSALSTEEKDDYGVETNDGVLIVELSNGGSAQYAGILPNDVIKNINGIKISSLDDLKVSMAKFKKNDIINITLQRGDKLKKLDVKLRN